MIKAEDLPRRSGPTYKEIFARIDQQIRRQHEAGETQYVIYPSDDFWWETPREVRKAIIDQLREFGYTVDRRWILKQVAISWTEDQA